MTDRDTLLRAVKDINPVPNTGPLPAELADVRPPLDLLTAELASDTTRRPALPRTPRRSRWTGPALAGAALLVVLLVALPLLFWAGDGGERPVATSGAPVTTVPPPPTTQPTPTTQAAPTMGVAEATIPAVPASLVTGWGRVPADPALENGWIADVVVGGPGLVAVGGTHDNLDAAVWVSADGISWERIESDQFGGPSERPTSDGDQHMNDVVSSPFGLVAVGSVEDAESHTFQAAVWLSDDGRSWSRVPHDEDVFGLGGSDYFIPFPGMHRVVVGGPGLVAIGSSQVWVSSDAVNWERVVDGDFDDVGGTFRDITAWDDRLVVVGFTYECCRDSEMLMSLGEEPEVRYTNTLELTALTLQPAVWLSDDGRSWERLPTDAVPIKDRDLAGASIEPWGMAIKAVTATDAGLVAVGHAVWFSADGTTWTLLEGEFHGDDPPDEPGFGTANIIELDGRLLATFEVSDTLWASEDGGATWHPSAQFDGGFYETYMGSGAGGVFATLNSVIAVDDALVAAGSSVAWSSTEDIGGICAALPGLEGVGSCRSDAAIWIGQWNE